MNWPVGWTSLKEIPDENFEEWLQKTCSENAGSVMRCLWWEHDPAEPPPGRERGEQRDRESPDALPEVSHCGAPENRNMGEGECPARELQDMRHGIPAEAQEEKGPSAVREPRLPEKERPAIGRTALGVRHRVERLRAIGNGQVPICAAMAFQLLAEDIRE